MRKIYHPKSGKTFSADANGNFKFDLADGKYVENGGVREYYFTTALVANTTATTAPAGSFAKTSHATGSSKIFVSDGAKWQAFAL